MNQLKEIFENTACEAILISDPHNMQYFSGFRGGEGMVYVSKSRRVLITDSRYTEAAASESDFTIIEETRQHRREEIVNECLKEDEADCVGYEDRYLHCDEFRLLQQKVPEVKQWMPLGHIFEDMRRIKTPQELETIRRAEEIGDIAFRAVLDRIRVGMTELELAAELEYQMKINGAQGLAFDTIAASGLNSSKPHAVPTSKKLEQGDFVTMDFGCCLDGYCSDMTRTVVMGKASEKQKEIYDITLRANLAALDVIKAGMVCRDVDQVARDIITEAGYGKCFGHGLGHSVGLYIHERPALSPSDATVLEPNMLETIEPGIYVPGFGGVRIEDLVVVTESGCEILSHSPKELLEL